MLLWYHANDVQPHSRSTFLIADEWLFFFERLSHVIGGCPEPVCPWQQPPGFVKACRQKLEPIYFRTRSALCRLRPLGVQGLEVFERFSGLLSVTEEKLQKKWRDSHECCNPLCELREQERVESMKKCNACGSDDAVYYHGQACQKAYVYRLLIILLNQIHLILHGILLGIGGVIEPSVDEA